MISLRRRNKNGFTYVVAIAMLGLLAFMGFFLMQSSSAEYSQTSVSVYRTMGRQIAEAAAEEAAVYIEDQFKDKSQSAFSQLLDQAATSGPARIDKPGSGGKWPTGLNPSFLSGHLDLKDTLEQTKSLINNYITRAGFVVEKVQPTITDLRPIPQGPLDFDYCYTNDPAKSCYYTPTDRYFNNKLAPYDSIYSKDWYCTLLIDVTVSLKKQQNTKVDYRLSKDIKLLNLGPIARNYTYYSILGIYVKNYDEGGFMQSMRLELNASGGLDEKGRLILWNQPFLSRVFLHGPAIINLENPNYGVVATDYNGRECLGAYNYPQRASKDDYGPGNTMAYQYSDSFYGFSYFPGESRCLYPKKSLREIWGGSHPATEEDMNTLQSNYLSLIEKETVVGGYYPDQNKGFWDRIKDSVCNGWSDTYFVGSNVNQMFLPAGPFCRTPWRYVAKTGSANGGYRYLPNRLPDPDYAFPESDPYIRIEHRWNPEDDEVGEQTKIYSSVYPIKYGNLTNGTSEKKEKQTEFGLIYHNDGETESFLERIGATLGLVGGDLFNIATLPFQAIGSGIGTLINKLKKPSSIDSTEEEKVFNNLFPTNFKYYVMSPVTRRLKDQTEIPLDEENNWILNGTYWLDSLTISDNVTYVGTGTLLVCRNTPVEIRGSVLAYRASEGAPPEGHLNIIYHPMDKTLRENGPYGDGVDVDKRMLTIVGSGITIEASVYSLCGIKCIGDCNITRDEMAQAPYYMDPALPMDKWKANPDNQNEPAGYMNEVMGKANCILGNYVNYYMLLNKQENDLWVVHNYMNPLFFKQYPAEGTIALVQDYIDECNSTANGISQEAIDYEKSCHEFFMSPKIQHVGIR